MIALHFFFRRKKDALTFFWKFKTYLQYLVECENVYGHCYDVVLCVHPPKNPDDLWKLGEREYRAASKLPSFIAHKSSSYALDISGMLRVLIAQT